MELHIMWSNGTKLGRTHRITVWPASSIQHAHEIADRQSQYDGFVAAILHSEGRIETIKIADGN